MSSFGRNMKAWAAKVDAGVDQVIRAASLQVSAAIIKRTPVDTGRAKGNWQPSINRVKAGQAQKTQTAPLSTIDSEQMRALSSVIAKSVGQVYYLTNNLPYIMRLEYQGWSTQAPNGMVRVSVLEFNAALRKAINEL